MHARLGVYITTLTDDEIKAVDKAISLSLDINHYYQTLQNLYEDKLQYIEKLKDARSRLQSDIAEKQQKINEVQEILEKYGFSDISSLSDFLENSQNKG